MKKAMFQSEKKQKTFQFFGSENKNTRRSLALVALASGAWCVFLR